MTKLFKTILFLCLFFLVFIFGVEKQTQASDPYYDLELTAITVVPSKPVFNQQCIITVKVLFTGEASLIDDAGIRSYYYSFDDFNLSSIVLPVVSPSKALVTGNSVSYIITGSFDELGSANLFFRTNNDGVLPEPGMSDNDLRIAVEVIPPDDLLVSSIGISPPNPAVDQDAIITVKVKNNGHLDLSTGIGIQDYEFNFESFYVESSVIPQVASFSKLLQGEVVDYIFEGHFSLSGDKALSFVIDNNNRMTENNEDNNELSKAITIGSVDNMDVSVDSIGFSKDTDKLVVGDEISVTVKIKNNSDFSITDGTGLLERDYQYSSGGDYEFNFPYLNLTLATHNEYPTPDLPFNPGSFFTYTFTGILDTAGITDVDFSIDIRDKLKEIDENNNALSDQVIIYQDESELYQFGIFNIKTYPISSTSARVAWETNKDTDGYVMFKTEGYLAYDRYLLKIGLDDWPASAEQQEHYTDLFNLESGKSYRAIINAYNATFEKESDIIEFSTRANDNINISGLNCVTNPGFATAVCKWQTSLLAKGTLYYKKTENNSYTSVSDSELKLNQEINLADLNLADYDYYVVAENKDGISEQSSFDQFSFGSFPTEPNIEENSSLEDTGDTAVITGNDDSTSVISISNQQMYSQLKGKIMLKVEDAGKAYYIHPVSSNMYYLGRPADAFAVMREQGVGISNVNIARIPVGLNNLTGLDSDGDGLPDLFEDAIGTEKNNSDSDNDGHGDGDELDGGYDPVKSGAKITVDNNFSLSNVGKIFLQVENNGEAWYINPADNKRYFLGRPADAFAVMRNISLGISNSDFNKL